MSQVDKMAQVILGTIPGKPQSEPAGGAPLEGTVVSVSSAGMTFTIDSWDDGQYLFGPAPWTQIGAPVAGDRCLVVFADTEPWVIGWWHGG
jgi:hypothetical protein